MFFSEDMCEYLKKAGSKLEYEMCGTPLTKKSRISLSFPRRVWSCQRVRVLSSKEYFICRITYTLQGSPINFVDNSFILDTNNLPCSVSRKVLPPEQRRGNASFQNCSRPPKCPDARSTSCTTIS